MFDFNGLATVLTDPMTVYLWCARLGIVLGLWAGVSKKWRPAGLAWAAATVCWILQLACFFYQWGFASLSGVAPTFCLAALVVCLMQMATLKADLASQRLRPRINGFFLVLLAASSMVTEDYRHDSFMMAFVYARLFFLSRPVSLGLTLFALGGAGDALGRNNPCPLMTAWSRNTAMLAALVFLGGEISGCYWGFVGWGTTWRWSGNFFYSAMMFVLYMVALHVPRSLFASAKACALALFTPLGLIVLAMTLSKVVNV